MSEIFSLEDIFNVMIGLESLGNVHYTNMQSMTDNAKLKVLFEQLAKAELAHKSLYEQFKSQMIAFNHEKVDSEYKEYMEALLNQTIRFLNESREIADFEKGFDISVQLEKDTILFLNELRGIVDTSYYDAIDQVIVQEQSHLTSLYKYKSTIL